MTWMLILATYFGFNLGVACEDIQIAYTREGFTPSWFDTFMVLLFGFPLMVFLFVRELFR